MSTQKDKVLQRVQESGFPLELQAGQLLHEQGYYVAHNLYYIDRDESFGANPELRKQLRQIRDWWWNYCATQAAKPDVGALYAGMEPYLRRIDESYQEVKDGLKSIEELKSPLWS